jgi:hypothetical protein
VAADPLNFQGLLTPDDGAVHTVRETVLVG